MAVWLVHARTILWIVMLHIQVIQLDVRFEDKGLQKAAVRPSAEQSAAAVPTWFCKKWELADDPGGERGEEKGNGEDS